MIKSHGSEMFDLSKLISKILTITYWPDFPSKLITFHTFALISHVRTDISSLVDTNISLDGWVDKPHISPSAWPCIITCKKSKKKEQKIKCKANPISCRNKLKNYSYTWKNKMNISICWICRLDYFYPRNFDWKCMTKWGYNCVQKLKCLEKSTFWKF